MSYVISKCLQSSCRYIGIQLFKPTTLKTGKLSCRSISFAFRKVPSIAQKNQSFARLHQTIHCKNGSSFRRLGQSAIVLFSCTSICLFLWNKHKARCHHNPEVDKRWNGMSIKLYQYQTCPFCSKTRFFLQAYNIPFEIVEVHPIFKKEIKFAESKKVPIVVIEKNGKTLELQDSSYIISVLGSYMINPNKSVEEIVERYPRKQETDESGKVKELILNKHYLTHDEVWKEQKFDIDPRREEAEWRMWADDHLVHTISPNVYRSLREAYQAFDHHVKQGRFNGTWEGLVAKYLGSVAMWMISKKLKKKYDLEENVRLDLYKACNKWIDAIGHDRKFMGGDKPNLADISVFGVLSVMEGLDSFEDLLTHSKIRKWYFKTKQAISDHNAQSLLVV